MFNENKPARDLWYETVHWWNDHTIKIRFVETGDDYWFVMGADSRRPDTNKYFYKILEKSENYERFKTTSLLTKANLSHSRLEKFVKNLTGAGLINKIEFDGRHTFVITEKGRQYLESYQKFSDLAGTFGLDL